MADIHEVLPADLQEVVGGLAMFVRNCGTWPIIGEVSAAVVVDGMLHLEFAWLAAPNGHRVAEDNWLGVSPTPGRREIFRYERCRMGDGTFIFHLADNTEVLIFPAGHRGKPQITLQPCVTRAPPKTLH